MRLMWLDFETTGLHAKPDEILEVAAIITGTDVDRWLGTFTAPVHASLQAMAQMDPFVRDMHTKNGLLADLARGVGVTVGEAEARLLSLAVNTQEDDGPLYLAGNSIHFDRGFLRAFMPSLETKLHYRMLDVSAIKIMGRDMLGIPEGKGAGAHRAMADVVESIQEYKFWALKVQK